MARKKKESGEREIEVRKGRRERLRTVLEWSGAEEFASLSDLLAGQATRKIDFLLARTSSASVC